MLTEPFYWQIFFEARFYDITATYSLSLDLGAISFITTKRL
jgi:hypothetical protein